MAVSARRCHRLDLAQSLPDAVGGAASEPDAGAEAGRRCCGRLGAAYIGLALAGHASDMHLECTAVRRMVAEEARLPVLRSRGERLGFLLGPPLHSDGHSSRRRPRPSSALFQVAVATDGYHRLVTGLGLNLCGLGRGRPLLCLSLCLSLAMLFSSWDHCRLRRACASPLPRRHTCKIGPSSPSCDILRAPPKVREAMREDMPMWISVTF